MNPYTVTILENGIPTPHYVEADTENLAAQLVCDSLGLSRSAICHVRPA